jgi:DUF1680 family protein
MKEIPFNQVSIQDIFWDARLRLNTDHSIVHQWQQLENSGCIHNFRILADQAPGFREGWFFSDSDAYKWLDAASRMTTFGKPENLYSRINELIDLIKRAQAPDGYLFTYNQIHFPGSRWQNLQIEHELYCHGHLIEAAVSHYEATHSNNFLPVGIKAADLLLHTFLGCGPDKTPGHEEIEIALIRLTDITGNRDYCELAEQFIEQRGRRNSLSFALKMLGENRRVNQRTAQSNQSRKRYYQEHPAESGKFKLPDHNLSEKPRFVKQRFQYSALFGLYFQQHRPIRNQTIPVGHAVRFAYLKTATAMLANRSGDYTLIPSLKKSWQHMVERRMYVTGGTGSLPVSEGFGRDYELDPHYAYAETCAALGTMFWNWEMTGLTGEASYADLFERQLYNASLVGMGQNGQCYLYNNPLASRTGHERQPWFEVPCCPSNLSRTWASLGKYLFTHSPGKIWVQQYIGSQVVIPFDQPLGLQMTSTLPWEGHINIHIHLEKQADFTLYLRIPSWSGPVSISINNVNWPMDGCAPQQNNTTASGYDPRTAQYLPIQRTWQNNDHLEITFDMPILIQNPHPRVKSTRGKIAIARGPLVYCLEGNDNPEMDLDTVTLQPATLTTEFDAEKLGGIITLKGNDLQGNPLTFIPYAWWANRGISPMTVYVNV